MFHHSRKMPVITFKIRNLIEKKVFASTIQKMGCHQENKLFLDEYVNVRVYLQDGTEVHDNYILQSLE